LSRCSPALTLSSFHNEAHVIGKLRSFISLPEVLRVAALILLSALIWCAIMHRWTAESWRTPLLYAGEGEKGGDAQFYFAEVKAAMDGRYWPLLQKRMPELGAPLVAVWNDYPTTEQFIIFLTGLVARGIGIFAACNLMTMLAQVLAAVAMYAVCRTLGNRWYWSLVAAVAFGFAPYAFVRGENHLDLTFYWHIPLCLLVTRWISVGQGLPIGSKKFWLSLVIAFVTGLQNQYYTFMFIQLVLLGALAQWARHGWRAVLSPFAVCASSLLGFVLTIFDSIVFQIQHGRNPGAVLRNYSQMEFYALKLLDLCIPFPGHRLFSGLADHYAAIVLVRGEAPPSGYLGLVGIAGLITLAGVTFVRLAKNSSPMPLEAAQILWIIVEGSVGGFNAIAGLFGFYLFRCTGRYSIFILALALLFLARQLSRWTRDRPVLAATGAATLLFVVLLDQTPPMVQRNQIKEIAQMVDSDRTLSAEMERRLSPGAMIFQLPLIDFPEAFPGACYDHFRPYLFSRHLRFSFGLIKGRPGNEWMQSLSNVSAPEAIDILKQHGFAAIYVDRAQNPDLGRRLFQGFSKMSLPIAQSPRGDVFCVFLNER
jgi:hypothetical protein